MMHIVKIDFSIGVRPYGRVLSASLCFCVAVDSFSSVAPLKSLYFHSTAICSSSIVLKPRSLFLLFVLLFCGPIVEDLMTAATPPHSFTYMKKLTETCFLPN